MFLQPSRNPKDKKTGREENKQFDPGGKGEEQPPWKAGVPCTIFFSGGCLCFVLLFVLVGLLCIVLIR